MADFQHLGQRRVHEGENICLLKMWFSGRFLANAKDTPLYSLFFIVHYMNFKVSLQVL